MNELGSLNTIGKPGQAEKFNFEAAGYTVVRFSMHSDLDGNNPSWLDSNGRFIQDSGRELNGIEFSKSLKSFSKVQLRFYQVQLTNNSFASTDEVGIRKGSSNYFFSRSVSLQADESYGNTYFAKIDLKTVVMDEIMNVGTYGGAGYVSSRFFELYCI